MKIEDLINDAEFQKRWPYVWNKLEQFFLSKQQSYVSKNPTNYEENGRFVAFIGEVMNDLRMIDVSYNSPEKPKIHKRLNRTL